MGKRLLTVLAVIAFLSGVVFSSLGGAADKQEAPDTIEILAKLWTKHTKGPVKLEHKKHNEEYKIKCTECHHVYDEKDKKKNTWKEGDKVKKCMECHNEATIKGEKKLPKDKQALNLKLAYHNNCQGCHKKLKKEDKEKYSKIPTTCIKCHTKSKKK
jgi:cytochrome c553